MSDVTGVNVQNLFCRVPVIADLVAAAIIVVMIATTGHACLVFRRILRSRFSLGNGSIDLLLPQLVVLLN